MLFYYLCTVGEKLHREAYPQGAQSKDADVYKWVTLYSGSPAVCQREHPAIHRWRPDEGGDEERVVRSYAVLQWDKEGFDLAKTKPEVGERFDSRWGPSLIVATRPAPDKPEFVRIGSKVTPDTTVCLVVAMKVNNEIKAGVSGTIVQVVATNDEFVGYNDVLFLVDPS